MIAISIAAIQSFLPSNYAGLLDYIVENEPECAVKLYDLAEGVCDEQTILLLEVYYTYYIWLLIYFQKYAELKMLLRRIGERQLYGSTLVKHSVDAALAFQSSNFETIYSLTSAFDWNLRFNGVQTIVVATVEQFQRKVHEKILNRFIDIREPELRRYLGIGVNVNTEQLLNQLNSLNNNRWQYDASQELFKIEENQQQSERHGITTDQRQRLTNLRNVAQFLDKQSYIN